jgi:repressor LexA
MQDFTPRQREILHMIRECILNDGRPPTRSEIAKHFGFKSPNSAEQHLKALARKGALILTPGTSRGIQLAEDLLTEASLLSNAHSTQEAAELPAEAASEVLTLLPPPTLISLPVIGRVAAGTPILAQENREMYYKVDPDLFRPRADYLLRVEGYSMRDVGILPHDLLAVHPVKSVHNGQVVIARVEGLEHEVTVKRFYRLDEQHVELRPENSDPEYRPIQIDLSRQGLVIEGLVVGMIRTNPNFNL